MVKVGFGGSCHWCTEAIFCSLKGVNKVDQGWISSDGEYNVPSEAVVVSFDKAEISLLTLVAIHLHTHSCTAQHSMRGKYRSAIYTYDDEQAIECQKSIITLQEEFEKPIITKVLRFNSFRLNEERYLNYYYKNPAKPFCKNVVNKKLKELLTKFGKHISAEHQTHFADL